MVGLFQKPNMELVFDVFKNYQKIQFQKGEFLFHQGDNPDFLYLLVEGKIQIFKYDTNYNEITLNFFSPVSLIAEWAVIQQIPYPASARFSVNSLTYRMSIQDLKNVLDKNPIFNQYFIYSLSEKLKILNTTIDRGLTMDSYQRVLHFLYYSPNSCFELQQTQIASLLCLRPETLSRIFKVLKAKKIIHMEKGKISNIDRQALTKDIDEKYYDY